MASLPPPSAELLEWVGDSLTELLGFADSTLAAFFCALASAAPSPAALERKLLEADVPVTPASRAFASQLWTRAPRRSVAAAAPRAARSSRAAPPGRSLSRSGLATVASPRGAGERRAGRSTQSSA